MKIGFHRHYYYIKGTLFGGRKKSICRECGARTDSPWWPLWKED